jgi:hypothetical protein
MVVRPQQISYIIEKIELFLNIKLLAVNSYN